MWRPFVNNIASHTFDNFIKKNARNEASEATKSRKFKGRLVENDLFPYRHKISEVSERMLKFEQLQEKVCEEKQKIKERDEVFKRNEELRRNNIRFEAIARRTLNSEERSRVRSFAKHNRLKSFAVEETGENFFSLTVPERSSSMGKPRSMGSIKPTVAANRGSKTKRQT